MKDIPGNIILNFIFLIHPRNIFILFQSLVISIFSYYEWFRSKFSNKRKILEEGLSAAGIEALPSHGGFFVMARLPKHDVSSYSGFVNEPYDWKLCRKIASDYGVIGIPASSFFSPGYEKTYGPLARFAFCKLDETLIEANLRFKKIN